MVSGTSRGPGSNSTVSPIPSAMVMMSAKMMAASSRYRLRGCRVISAATAGVRIDSWKEC